ncbi:MAG: sulfotransferase [Bacteroidota bacterium]
MEKVSTLPERLPDFYMVGGQKCGSTFVHRMVDEHPDVYMPHFEVRFLESPDFDDSGRERFLALFDGQPTHIKVGSKAPAYMDKPEEHAPRIKAISPDAVFVGILRNPVKRAISAYFHYTRYGLIPPMPLEEGFDKILNREMGIYQAAADQIIEFGMFAKHIEVYHQHFDPNQFLFITYDELKADNLGELKRIYDFIGVNADFADKQSFDRTSNKSIYSLKRLKVRKAILDRKFAYYLNRTRFRKKKRNLIDQLICSVLLRYDRLILARTVKDDVQPKASEALLSRLREMYREDIEHLEDLLDKDLSAWLKRGEGRGDRSELKEATSGA